MHPHDLDRFQATGLVKLPGLLPDELTTPALHRVHEDLERAGLREDGVWRFERLGDELVSRSNKNFRKKLRYTSAFADLVTPELTAAVEAAAGESVQVMLQRPQVLFNFPQPGRWSVPHSAWHVDLPKLPNRRVVPGVQAFAILDTVEPGGGGTVVVEGCHRLLQDIPFLGSEQVKYRLRREPWFRRLMSREVRDRGSFLRESEASGGARLRVVELTGRRGDVYLVDMRLLHSPAPNVASTPRIMWTQRFLTKASHRDMTALWDQARTLYGAEAGGRAAAAS